MRTRRRYLALKIDCDREITGTRLVEAIWNAVTQLFGEYGASKVDLGLVAYNAVEKAAIVRTAQASISVTRAAIASITAIDSEPVAVHVMRVSGTIRSLAEKMKGSVQGSS